MENKKPKLLVVGHDHISNATMFDRIKELGVEVVVIESDDLNSNTININGVLYEEIGSKKQPWDRFNIPLPQVRNYLDKVERKLPEGIDLVKEFGLIELKQSGLNKWERDMVVIEFNKKYRKVEK